MKVSKYKGKLDRCEVESVVAPLRDKEPTPAWRKQFKSTLKHYGVSFVTLSELAANSNKVNLLGRRYGKQSLQSLLGHYNEGRNDWTKNGFRTINDYLDVLVDYLSKPEEKTEEEHVPTLRERLEKERVEGKWPSVDERIKEKTKNVSKGLITGHIDIPELIKAIDKASETNNVHVKRVRKNKKHKKHKSNNIYITINIGR